MMYSFKNVAKTYLFALASSTLLLLSGGAFAEDSPAPANSAEDADSSPQTWRSPFFSPVVSNLYLLGGVGFYDVDGMNDALSDNGYSSLSSPALSLGLGTDLSIGRLIVGVEWNNLKNVGTDSERNDIGADIKGHYWLARLGVDLVKWRGLRVYPLFGIGMSTTKITLTSETGASFDDVLADPGRDSQLRRTDLLLDAFLGIDYRFKVRETDYKSSFFTVGVRGGYLFAPYSKGWSTGGAEISGGPDSIMGGPTVQLMIGFSGERKKRHPMGCNCDKH